MADKCECPNLLDNAMSNAFSQSRAKFRIQHDTDKKIIYFGQTNATMLENDPHWSIQKFIYNSEGCITGNSFPKVPSGEGNSYFNFKWSDRESYEYV